MTTNSLPNTDKQTSSTDVRFSITPRYLATRFLTAIIVIAIFSTWRVV